MKRIQSSTQPSSGGTTISKGDEEIKRLKKELKDAYLELEILKKAVHIFTKSDGKSTSS